MLSYAFMKILEGRPPSYDQRMNRLSGGRVEAMKRAVAARIPAGARVLEIGCGTGELGELLCERGAIVEGFDRSPSMIATARERIRARGLEGRLACRQMEVESMDRLAEREYDAVVATLVLSELRGQVRRFTLRQALRVLKPGGSLVVADEVRARSGARRLVQALARLPVAATAYLVTGSTTRPIADLAAEVSDVGFHVEGEERGANETFALLVARRPTEG